MIALIPIVSGLLIRFYIKNIGFFNDKSCKSFENNLKDKQYLITAASVVLLWVLLSKLASMKKASLFCKESLRTAFAFAPFLFLSLSLLHCRFALHYLVCRSMMALALGLSISMLIRIFFSPKQEILGIQASWIILIIIMLFYLVVFIYCGFVVYEQGATIAFDYASRINMIWNTAHGRFLYRSLYQNCFLGSHFSPILAVLAPLYWTSYPVYLQIIITKLLAIGVAVPMFLLAKKKIRDNFLSLSMATAVLFSALYQTATYSELYAVHFEPIIIVLIFYFMEKEKWMLYGIFCGLLLLTMEDKFLPLMMTGTYLLYFRKRRLAGALTIIAAAFAGCIINLWIMPLFRTAGSIRSKHFERYKWLGKNLFEMVRTIFTRPFYVLGYIFNGQRLPTMFFVFTPLLFLPFISGGVILTMLPAFLGMFISVHPFQYKLMKHYAPAPITFAVVATIYAAARIYSGKAKFPFLSRNPHNSAPHHIALFIGCYLLISNLHLSMFVPNSFLNIIAKPVAFSNEDEKIAFRKKMEHEIPSDASVWVSDSLCTHFAQRIHVSIFSAKSDKNIVEIIEEARNGADSDIFVVVDTACVKYNALPCRGIMILLRSELFEVYDFYLDEYVILKAGKPTGKNDEYIAHCWSYLEAEDIAYEKSGRSISDVTASKGMARTPRGPARKKMPFVCGPNLRYPAGEYKANFYLKIFNPQNGAIAEINAATENGNKIIASRTIDRSEFANDDVYLPFAISFTLKKPAYLDFGIKYLGNAELFADKIIVTSPALTEIRKKSRK